MNLYIYKTPEGQIDHYIDETWDEDYADCQKFHFDIQERVILERIEAQFEKREVLADLVGDIAQSTLKELAVELLIFGKPVYSLDEIKAELTETIRESVVNDIVIEYIGTINAMMEDAA